MKTISADMKQKMKKEEGFTLVEVIAVLVILGILAAVAIPKFFDMQDTAREKAIQGAIGELNGQVALSFAQNALIGGDAGDYNGYTGDIGPEFIINNVGTNANTAGPGGSGTIEIRSETLGAHVWDLDWTEGGTDQPGYFEMGNKN